MKRRKRLIVILNQFTRLYAIGCISILAFLTLHGIIKKTVDFLSYSSPVTSKQ